MFHDLCTLITNNPLGSFIVILALIWACERVVTALINRNKPECECECCIDHPDDDDEDEVVAMGGEEDDEEDDK